MAATSPSLHPAPASVTTINEALSQPIRILFMRVVFPDVPQEPITVSEAQSLMSQVRQWYAEGSYGKVDMTFDVTPLLTLPQTRAWYSQQALTQLLVDARAEALAVGFDSSVYDYDIARHLPVPGWDFSGLSLTGQKGLWLQLTHVGVVVHELGHNLGLQHANLWAALSDSIIGPGTNVEYGNVFDTMSTPEADPRCCDFNVFWKHRLNWLAQTDILDVSNSLTVRLHAFDTPTRAAGRIYGLRIPKDDQKYYWVEFRQKLAGNPWAQSGVWINWSPWSESRSGTQLLDATPGTPSGHSGVDDAPLVVGRTLSDGLDGVHITPLSIGSDESNRWIDVRVNLGSFPGNQSPLLSLLPNVAQVAPNEAVQITATAADPDGDPLAYGWDFGDLTFGMNSNQVFKSWSRPGRYVVRCTISDLKGGTCSRFVVIGVGSTNLWSIAGRVLDSAGQPVAGVRIHNGSSGELYRGTETDCDGRYVLANLSAGNVALAAVKYGYQFQTDGWTNPLAVATDVPEAHWTAARNPLIRVVASDDFAEEPGGMKNNGAFTIERTAPVTTSLTVRFRVSGTAALSLDYQLMGVAAGATMSFVLPPGMAATNLVVSPAPDPFVEKPESVILTLLEDAAYQLDPMRRAAVWISDAPSENNRNPVAVEDLVTRFVPGIAQISVSALLSNDSDPDGDPILFAGVQPLSAFGADIFEFEGTIYYLPPSNFGADDSFIYTISDGRAGTADGIVRVISRPPPPPILTLSAMGNLRQLSGSNGVPGQTHRVEFSESGAPFDWRTWGGVTNDSLGRFSILDTAPGHPAWRFYRTVSP